jgi:cell division protein ZapE
VTSSARPPASGPVLDRYETLVEGGEIERDPAQVKLVRRLDALAGALGEHRLARKGSALGWLFGRKAPAPPQGLYVWGGVGRGKTMLMDLFFEGLPVRRKRRVHFHAFMSDVHERIHAHRRAVKEGRATDDDPIRPVAEALASEAWVLCFDEFAVTDIADAMILGRLFTALLGHGVVVGPRPPTWSRTASTRAASTASLFLPFIDLLRSEWRSCASSARRTDFRLAKLAGEPVYHVPATGRPLAPSTRFAAFGARRAASP